MVLGSELHVVLLLFIVWSSELACKRVNVSPIIGQIAAGLVIGPALLDLFAHVEVFRLLGKLGVMIVVIESGLTVDVRVLRKVGNRAFLVGITGVILPTVISFALYAGLLGADWKTALSVGAALSPTSLGFSAQLLGEVGELTTPVGQLICTAAVIDDVLSLLLLAEVQALGDEDPKWYAYAVPVLGSVGSVALGILATVFVSSKTEQMDAWLTSLNDSCLSPSSSALSPRRERLPSAAATSPDKSSKSIPRGDLAEANKSGDVGAGGGAAGGGGRFTSTLELATLAEADGEPGGGGGGMPGLVSRGRLSTGVGGDGGDEGWVGTGDRALLAMVLALSLLFAYASSAMGSSDLLGCFFGGVAFSGVPGVGKVWERQMKRFSQWGLRLFFAATVAFSVPSIYRDGGLLRVGPFWKGLVLTVAAVAGKLAVGVFAGPPLTLAGFLKLGWAMNGRGEFSFLIAQEASDEGVLLAEDYSAVVWALLLSSLATPIAFRRVLFADRRAQEKGVAAANQAQDGGGGGGGGGGGEGSGSGADDRGHVDRYL